MYSDTDPNIRGQSTSIGAVLSYVCRPCILVVLDGFDSWI